MVIGSSFSDSNSKKLRMLEILVISLIDFFVLLVSAYLINNYLWN